MPIMMCALALAAQPAQSDRAQLTAPAMLAGTVGQWRGELQYRDYQSNRWEGLPMTVNVVAQPDGVTTIRTARYDDGPKTGFVTITTVSLVDPAKAAISYASARANRGLDTGIARIVSQTPGADRIHWTLVTQEHRMDGDGMAEVRETTVRDGDTLTTLKEVDPDGDGVAAWQPRNRTILKAVR